MDRICPACHHINRPEATWCERCRKGLTLRGRMAQPWGRTGIAGRITTTWALLAGSGCLLFFLFPPVGIVLLAMAARAQYLWKRSVAGVCPHCRQDTGSLRAKGPQPDFPCVHCRQTIRLDTSSGAPVFVKPPAGAEEPLRPEGEPLASATAGTAPPAGVGARRTSGRLSPESPPGQPGPVAQADWGTVALGAGHPRVKRETAGGGVNFRVRSGSLFGWLWLSVTAVVFGGLLIGLFQGDVLVLGEPVPAPSFWHFLGLAALCAPFALIGLAFTAASYTVSLAPNLVTVRWRIVPGVGWTWTLPAGWNEVRVSLAHRGASVNRVPVPAVVVACRGREIGFGSFLPGDVKEFLGAAIHRHYNGAGPG